VAGAFIYRRRVQFAETDMAGIVHFSCYFRYMEEAEHALWRAAGLHIATVDEPVGWPRIASAFEYRSPLHFEEEFEVSVSIAALTRRTIQYGFTFVRDATAIGAGTITAVCVRKGPPMKAIELPADVVARLRAAAERQSGSPADGVAP
jgi:acyl-CoA thioester hydrolase